MKITKPSLGVEKVEIGFTASPADLHTKNPRAGPTAPAYITESMLTTINMCLGLKHTLWIYPRWRPLPHVKKKFELSISVPYTMKSCIAA